MKNLGKAKEGNPIDTNIKRPHRRIVLVGGLRHQMAPDGRVEIRHPQIEVMLKDLIRRPAVHSRLGKVHVLPVRDDLAFAAVQAPNEDDFVLASATVRPRQALRQGFGICHAEFESHALFGKAKRLGGVLDIVVNLVGSKHDTVLCWGDLVEDSSLDK